MHYTTYSLHCAVRLFGLQSRGTSLRKALKEFFSTSLSLSLSVLPTLKRVCLTEIKLHKIPRIYFLQRQEIRSDIG